jgi:hypothetical protein
VGNVRERTKGKNEIERERERKIERIQTAEEGGSRGVHGTE